MASRAAWVKLPRQRAPEYMPAFEGAIVAADLMARPYDCRCTWVPRFMPVRQWLPDGDFDIAPAVSYQVRGFIRKFRDAACRYHWAGG